VGGGGLSYFLVNMAYKMFRSAFFLCASGTGIVTVQQTLRNEGIICFATGSFAFEKMEAQNLQVFLLPSSSPVIFEYKMCAWLHSLTLHTSRLIVLSS